MKSLSGLLPVLAIILSLDSVRARPQNGPPTSGVAIVEKVERVNLHEKVDSPTSNNRYFLLESYFLPNSTESECKTVQNLKHFNVSPDMKSFMKFFLTDSAISEMSILANQSQIENNTNINRFFEIIDKYRISKSKPLLNFLFLTFKTYLSDCKALNSENEDEYRCSCGHFKEENGSKKDANQMNESKSCAVFIKFVGNYDAVMIFDLNDESSECMILNLKLVSRFPPSISQQAFKSSKSLLKHVNPQHRSKRRIESTDQDSKEWVPISVSSKSNKVKIRPILGARRKNDDEIVQQFFETSIPALKASLIDKPVVPESLDELILLHTFHGGIIKKNLSVQIGGNDDPLKYPSSYSTTIAAPGIVVNNAIESSSPVYSYPTTNAPSSTTAIYLPGYDYPIPVVPTGEIPLEWPPELTKPSDNYGSGLNHVTEVTPTFVEPVNVPVNFLPSTDDATPLNPLTAFNGQTSSAILVIASPSDQSLEDIAGEVVADDAVGGAAGGAGAAGAAAVVGGATAAGAAGAAGIAGAAAGAAAAGVAAAGGAAGGIAGGAAGAALGAGALAAAAGAGAAAGAAAGVAAGATAGVAAGAATGIAVGAAVAGGANNAGGGGIGFGGGGGGVGGGGGGGGIGGGGIGGVAIDQSGAGAILATNVVAPSDDSDASLMDYVASIFGGMNILNPIGFTFWSMMFAPLSIILTSGLSMFAFLFPWLFPALWFGRSTAGHRSHSWYSHPIPSYYSDSEMENLNRPYIMSYQRDTSHSSSIPINRKHVRKRRKRRSLLVV